MKRERWAWIDWEKASSARDVIYTLGLCFIMIATSVLLYFVVDIPLNMHALFQTHYPPEFIGTFLAGVVFLKLGLIKKMMGAVTLIHFLLWAFLIFPILYGFNVWNPILWSFSIPFLAALHLILLAGYFWGKMT